MNGRDKVQKLAWRSGWPPGGGTVPDAVGVAHTEVKEEDGEDGHSNLAVKEVEGDHEAREAKGEEEQDLDEELGAG